VPDAIIYIDPDQPMNLQNQIRQKLVDGILNGSFAPGMKLPSSRKLAQRSMWREIQWLPSGNGGSGKCRRNGSE